jgi:heptosyltransferase-1
MTEILFVKTSSLGDVIHHMPAVTESRAHFPQARIAWLVEEAYAPLVALHPGVHRVIGVAWRRWRRQLLHAKAWREFGEWRRQLGADRFDHIVDTQGLLRSAVMSRFARGPRHGYDRDSVRERPAAMFYDVRHRVSRAEHAVARNRMLTGLALGYRPEGAPDYGLDRSRLREAGEPYAVLLHGTAQRDKEWPVENWIALGRGLGHSLGRGLLVPWGNETERLRAVQIVEAVPHARLAERRPIEGMARLIAGADCVVGGDTGLVHLAAALGVPLVAIFCGSDPALTRPVGAGPIETVGAKGIVPPVEDVRDALDKILR